MRFLQANAEEGNARDPCRKFTSTSQLSEESTFEFAIGCFEMRQKVIITFKQCVEITCDPNILQ